MNTDFLKHWSISCILKFVLNRSKNLGSFKKGKIWKNVIGKYKQFNWNKIQTYIRLNILDVAARKEKLIWSKLPQLLSFNHDPRRTAIMVFILFSIKCDEKHQWTTGRHSNLYSTYIHPVHILVMESLKKLYSFCH